jgi:hypothetical protein
VGDLVALVSANQDPFWLARVKKIKKDGKFDVYFRFKIEEQLFTKGKTILKQALKKIAQACLTYNGQMYLKPFK